THTHRLQASSSCFLRPVGKHTQNINQFSSAHHTHPSPFFCILTHVILSADQTIPHTHKHTHTHTHTHSICPSVERLNTKKYPCPPPLKLEYDIIAKCETRRSHV